MADRWTPQQLQAIEARDTAVIVSAAAGSGKTSVLVERLLRQISSTSSKIPADRFVVVTFTNDAAAEMKQRLTVELSKRIEQEPENFWLSEQQALIQSAKISTIHSFCFDLIRENIRSLDISPGFRIMEETEERVVVAKALEDTFEEFYRDRAEDMAELVDFFCTRGDRALENVLLSLHRFVLSVPFYMDWLEEQRALYRPENNSNPWMEGYTAYLSEELAGLMQDTRIARTLAEDMGAQEAALLIKTEGDSFEALSQTLSDSTVPWKQRAAGFDAIAFGRIKFPKAETGSPEAETADRIKKIRDAYKKRFAGLSGDSLLTEEEMHSDLEIHYQILTKLAALLNAFCKKVWENKVARNAIGFSDAEQQAVALLAEKTPEGIVPTALAKELSDYYQVIMIDEFQDVNNTQDLIFKMLSHNGTSLRNGDNLFVVGDVKQSIYRFRQSNPAIFMETLQHSAPYTEDFAGKNAAILLNRNFRSSREVVAFVNFVFSGIMSRRVGEIDYTDAEKLVQGAQFNEGCDRAAEILLVPAQDEAEEEEEQAISAEARVVAARIHRMLAEKHPVWDRGEVRPCRSRDFCILLRNKASGGLFVRALEKYGLKAHTDEVEGYLKSREISVLLNILQIIDNPLLDIPLVSVLMSPMFLFSAEEVAAIRLLCPEGSMYKALCTSIGKPFFGPENAESQPADEGASYFKKAVAFDTMLEQLRFYASSYSLEKLIRLIYDRTDFMSVMQLFRDGEQKKANLRLLLEYAKNYEQGVNGGLSGFIRYIHTVSRQGGDLKQAGKTSGADDVVAVKTIHKSKGLEFPFVFLCRTSGKFNRSDLNAQMQLHLTGGIGFKIQEKKTLKRYNSLPYMTVRRQNAANASSEEMRLLYVALTRAKEKLFITLDITAKTRERLFALGNEIKLEGAVTPRLASKADCMQDWLFMALLLHPDCGELRQMAQAEFIPAPADFRVHLCKPEDIPKTDRSQQMLVAASLPDPEKIVCLRRWAESRYDSAQTELPAKWTVSELSKGDDPAHPLSLRRPSFITERKTLTGAEKGVAAHTFMQYADFAAAAGNVPAELDRLGQLGYLTEKQKNAVDTQKLEEFFRSGLYGRIARSLKVERERKFLMKIADLNLPGELGQSYAGTDGMLQGIADCLFEEADGLVLIDYKTDYVQHAEELIRMYARQLELYRYALDQLYEKKVKEILIYAFSLGQPILLWKE